MCGFIGRINKADSVPRITTALRFLGRRGPDSHATWASKDRVVELLHVRLAIVDTDIRASQPFTDTRHGITVAFNGEIYNYRELRNEISDYEFQTESDTEVIIALFVTRGLAGLQRLRGMFALVLVDANARRVYLARDPIGKKPLFLARWSGGTYFGSTALSLVAASNEEVRVASESMDQFWEDGHAAPDVSLLEGCKPVAPGQIIELDWRGEVLRSGSCTPIYSDVVPSNVDEVRERVAQLIMQAVERRLTNNPQPVCLLSGGVDSTVVASFMKRLVGGSTITLGSFLPNTNDEKFARVAGKRLELPLQVVRARSSNLARDVCWSLDLQDEPLGMISFFPLSLMIRTAKDYGKILLTGDGGDEVFLGYGSPQDWTERDSPIASGYSSAIPPPPWMSAWGKTMATSSLVGHMFTKLDRASAEQGVEARCPLLDVDLVAFARRLTPQSVFFDGRPKALLKDQLADWPDKFVNRPKMGFAYNLRWAWAATRFAGLREIVSREAIDTFEESLPRELRAAATSWTTVNIFRNFSTVWKLMAWSRFKERLNLATDVKRSDVAYFDNAANANDVMPAGV